MKYSIVIPAYERTLLLKNTLEALNRQEGYGRGDYEVIVVDDGSTENTYAYIKDLGRNFTLKYHYLERGKDSSRSRARNFGWKAAAGDFIIFIDSDILVGPDYLLQLDRCFSLHRDIIVIGNRFMLPERVNYEDIRDGSFFRECRASGKLLDFMEMRHFLYNRYSYNASAYPFSWSSWTLVYSCNMAMSRACLEETGGFDEDFKTWGHEDVDLALRACRKGAKVVINSKLEVFHQFHGETGAAAVNQGFEANLRQFYEKNSDILQMPWEFFYFNFTGRVLDKRIVDNFLKEVNPGFRRKVKLRFTEPDCLEKLKSHITALMETGKRKVFLYDYLENTNLDIWVQLLDAERGKSIRYFPVSKRISMHEEILHNVKKLPAIKNPFMFAAHYIGTLLEYWWQRWGD